jgi:hypothetical protein
MRDFEIRAVAIHGHLVAEATMIAVVCAKSNLAPNCGSLRGKTMQIMIHSIVAAGGMIDERKTK